MNLKGAVNTIQALREVGNASKLGVWTQHLRDAAAHCAPKEQTSDLLISVWQELSLDVHGFSWKGPDVQFSASLSEQAKCVVGRALQKNGLENKERVINTFHRSCAQRKKESACLNYHALDNRRTQTSCHLREGPLFPASPHSHTSNIWGASALLIPRFGNPTPIREKQHSNPRIPKHRFPVSEIPETQIGKPTKM